MKHDLETKTGPLQEPKTGLSLPKERTITCHDRNFYVLRLRLHKLYVLRVLCI